MISRRRRTGLVHGAQASAVPGVSPERLRAISRRPKPTAKPSEARPLTAEKQGPDRYRSIWTGARDSRAAIFDRSVNCRQRFALDPLEVPIPDTSIVVQHSRPGWHPWEIHEHMPGRIEGFRSARTATVVEPAVLLAARSAERIAEQGRDFCAEILSQIRLDLKSAAWWMHWWGFYAGWAVTELDWELIPAGPLAGFQRPRLREVKPWRLAWKYPEEGAIIPRLYARRATPAEAVPIPWNRAIWFAPRSREPYGWIEMAGNEQCYNFWELEKLATIDNAGVVAMVAQILLIAKSANGMDDDRFGELADEAENLRTIGLARLLDGETLEALEVNSTSGANTAGPFIEAMQRTQAGIIGGQTDTQGMSQGPGAGLAGRRVGSSVSAKMAWTDAELLGAGFAEKLCHLILAQNFGVAVAERATPRATFDCWDVESWQLHQDGVRLLHEIGAAQDVRDAYKFCTRSSPPAPDTEVIPGRSAPQVMRTGDDLADEVAADRDLRSPEEVEDEVERVNQIVDAHRRNAFRRVA